MTFTEKIKLKEFWVNFFKVTSIFLFVVILFSLLMNSGKDIFSGNWNAVMQTNFANGRWVPFFSYKIVFTTLYGFYTVNKNMK